MADIAWQVGEIWGRVSLSGFAWKIPIHFSAYLGVAESYEPY